MILKDLIAGSSSKTRESSETTSAGRRAPSANQRMLFDILNRAMIGEVLQPQQLEIPTPTRQAIGGLQSYLPFLFGKAGETGNHSLASRLTAGGIGAPGGAPPAAPTFGAMPTREELGLTAPTLAPPGFLPTPADAVGSIPPVRVDPASRRENRLVNRIDLREAAGRPHAGADRKLAKLRGNPKYLRGSI